MKAAPAFAATLWCLAALLTSHPSSAQSSDEWRFQAIVYVYLPSVDGETTFPSSGGGGTSVDASKLLENLNFAFMSSFEASKGSWGMFTDVIYLDIGDSESPSRDISIGGGTLPVGASATIRYDLNGWLWTLAGSWRVASAPNYELNLIGGARLLDIDQNIDWQLSGNIGTVALPERAGDRMAGVNNWDAIIGLKGRATFGEERRWFVPYYVDVGTGDSSLTWQATAGVGYAFGWGDVMCAWRHIDYDMKSGKSIESIIFDGPGLAVAFRW